MPTSDSQVLIPTPPPVVHVPPRAPQTPPVPSHTQLPPPIPKQQGTTAAASETNDSEPPKSWGGFFITVPSWAVSMIVHMIVIIVLALCTVAPKFADQLIVVQASYTDPADELIEEPLRKIEFEAPTEHRFAAIEAAGEIGVADFGNAAEVSSSFASVDDGDLAALGEQ